MMHILNKAFISLLVACPHLFFNALSPTPLCVVLIRNLLTTATGGRMV